MSENSDNSYETEIIIDQGEPDDQSEQPSHDSSKQYEEDYDMGEDQGDKDFEVDNETQGDLGELIIDKINPPLYSTGLYLLILEQHDEFKDYIGELTELNENYFILNNETEPPIQINLDDVGNIIYKLDDNRNIIDILNIKEVEPEIVLNGDDIFKDDEIKLNVEEVDKQFRKYNETEIKEDFISEIINLYNIFDDELLIKKITDMSYSFFDLIKDNKSISDIDRTDVLSFVKSMINNNDFELPYYILPITALKKKIYEEGDESLIGSENIIISDVDKEIVDKYNSMHADGNGYIKSLESLFSTKYNSYINNLDKNGFIINYQGHIIRECLDDSCVGFNINNINNYKIDLLKSREELYTLDNSEKNIYVNSDQFNITGLLFIPVHLSNYRLQLDLKNNHFNLFENVKLSHRSYSIKSFRESFLENDFISNKINNDSLKAGYNKQLTAYLFDLENNITLDKLSELLSKSLPNNKSIINSIDKKILKYIYNFEDFEKLLLFYNIKINDLLEEDKNEIIDLIKLNINNYEKIYKKILKSVIKPLKKVKYITKELNIHEKIKLCREYILRNTNIIERNYLLTKFIKIYCREANNLTENNNWLYSNKTNEQILCKHYLYSSKIDKNPEYYDNLKSLFCPQSDEGHITCVNCGHLIDNVDFSSFQGYSDGKVVNTTAALEQEVIVNVSEGNTEIKKHINMVLKNFNIKLFPDDLENIVEIMVIFDTDKLTDFRYNESNYINKYSKSYVYKGKNGKENPKKKNAIIKNYKKYIENLNYFLTISFLIFIHIQISSNIYKNVLISDLLDYDENETWKLISTTNNHKSINSKLITYIKKKLIDHLEKNRNLLLQKEEVDDQFDEEFIKTIKYFLQPQFNLYNKINRYFILNKSTGNEFTKETWPTYKPIYDNKLVMSINKYISSKDHEMKDYFINNDSFENISLLKDINKIEPKFIEYKLPVSTLIGNQSYKRLYMYSLKLNGKSRIFPILNLLANKFLEDINDSKINDLFTKCHFKNNKFTEIDYGKLQSIIIGEITKYEIENTEDRDNIEKFKYINLNNTDYLLLNGQIKTHYKYIPAVIFIDSNYEELTNNNGEFLIKLFKNYCIADNDELIVNTIDENLLNYYLIDYNVELSENIPECKKVSIPPSEENFIRIMEYLPNKNKLIFNQFNYIEYTEKYSNDDIYKYLNFNKLIENRLISFFKDKYLEDPLLNNIFKTITDLKTSKVNQELIDYTTFTNKIDEISVNIVDTIDNYFENIDELFGQILINDKYNQNFVVENLQIKRFKSIPISGLNNVEHSSKILNKLATDINNPYIYKRLIDDIFYTLSCIKNNKHTSKIKKGLYKLSDANNDSFNEFLTINNLLCHDDLFFKRSQSELDNGLKYKGFKQYFHENNLIYFEELYDYIKDFNNNLDKLRGISNNLLDNEFTLKINKYIFVFIINKISDYIKGLIDTDSDIYLSLNSKLVEINNEEINIDNAVICLSKFLLDILINMYEKYYDINWVYISEELLNKAVMKQVSREKQTYLKKTTQMTKEQKYKNDLMNGMGKGTLYKESEKENTKYAISDEYEQETLKTKKELLNTDAATDETYQADEGYDTQLYDQAEQDEGEYDNS